jgi:hypothetical protein
VHPVVPGAAGWRQTPTVAPLALLQSPPQHSRSEAQASPVCVQYEPPVEQTPFVQNFEQQSAWAMHELPAVLQDPFRGTQVPLQLPLQHCAELVHAWLSDVHCVEPQVPPLQTKVQQSCGTEHEAPGALQEPVDEQTCACESQVPEQQSPLPPQASPSSLHEPPPAAPPVGPPVPVLVPPAPDDPLPDDPPTPLAAGPVMPSTFDEPPHPAQRIQTKIEMTAAQTTFLTSPSIDGSSMPPPIASAASVNGSSLSQNFVDVSARPTL